MSERWLLEEMVGWIVKLDKVEWRSRTIDRYIGEPAWQGIDGERTGPGSTTIFRYHAHWFNTRGEADWEAKQWRTNVEHPWKDARVVRVTRRVYSALKTKRQNAVGASTKPPIKQLPPRVRDELMFEDE